VSIWGNVLTCHSVPWLPYSLAAFSMRLHAASRCISMAYDWCTAAVRPEKSVLRRSVDIFEDPFGNVWTIATHAENIHSSKWHISSGVRQATT
jgi:hypothetical protein